LPVVGDTERHFAEADFARVRVNQFDLALACFTRVDGVLRLETSPDTNKHHVGNTGNFMKGA
jgi:hypothetical protein